MHLVIKLVSFQIFLLFVQNGYTLDCHACYKDQCENQKWGESINCGKNIVNDPTKVPVCTVFQYTNKQTGKKVYQRNCATAIKMPNGDIQIGCPQLLDTETVVCQKCQTDFCNGNLTSISETLTTIPGASIPSSTTKLAQSTSTTTPKTKTSKDSSETTDKSSTTTIIPNIVMIVLIFFSVV